MSSNDDNIDIEKLMEYVQLFLLNYLYIHQFLQLRIQDLRK